MALDCEACGACCTNAAENEREGRRDYVPVERGAKLLTRADLVRRWVDMGGEPHMKLDGEGRCLALRGKLGHRVRCEIYHQRPSAGRRVQPGDGDCLRARRERGLADGD